MSDRRLLALIIVVLLLATRPAVGEPQTEAPLLNHPRQVYIDRGMDGSTDQIVFIELITGERTTAAVPGRAYTLLNDAVLFEDRVTRRVRLLAPDGTTRDHPFIQRPPDARRIDWVISPDRRQIAWTITTGQPDALMTTTYLIPDTAIPDNQPRLLLSDGPRDGIRAFPVAFISGRLIMDYQPDTIADLLPVRLYAALFAVDLDTGAMRSLPGEAGCFCGAAVAGDQFVRITLEDDGGFSLRVIDLTSLVQRIISPIARTQPEFSTFTQAGDLLIAPDGASAAYALLRIHGAASPDQTLETAIIGVDLATMTQRVLLPPTFDRIQAIAWTDDSAGLLLRDANQPGTWLLQRADGRLTRIASLEYLGNLTPAAR